MLLDWHSHLAECGQLLTSGDWVAHAATSSAFVYQPAASSYTLIKNQVRKAICIHGFC